jgi:glycosyltransferase involved in cell wall biosynthesis
MSNKKIKLTIVIPAYNEEGYLKPCLDSIALQSITPDEVIVVDNNSTDSTASIARSYNFVRLISESKQGVFFASFRGFKAARGDIIARIDADTLLPENWVSLVKGSFSDGVSAVTGPVYYYDMPLGRSNYWFDHIMRKITYKWSRHTPFLYGSNMAVKRSDWWTIAPNLCTDRDIHEDIDVAIHLSLEDKNIVYDKKFISGASGRRYNDSLAGFAEYISMYKRTFSKHRMRSWAIYPAVFMWFLGYTLIHPWRKLWYLSHILFKESRVTQQARKNPMSAN